MPEDDAVDAGERTIGVGRQTVDPDDCATLVTHPVAAAKPAAQDLERRIATIDRIIDSLKK